jgi:hypothetical protein
MKALEEKRDAQKALIKDLSDRLEAKTKNADKTQALLNRTNTELAIAKRDNNNVTFMLEHKIRCMERRLRDSNEEAKKSLQKKLDAEGQVEGLTTMVNHQANRLKACRECIDRCVAINNKRHRDSDSQVKLIADMTTRLETSQGTLRDEREDVKRLTGLLECREMEVRALEEAKKKLETQLLLGEEFIEVAEEDAEDAVSFAPDESQIVVIEDEDADDSATGFEAVDGDDCAYDFEEVNASEAGEMLAEDASIEGFGAVSVDEDEEGVEAVNETPEVRVQ